MDYRTQEIMRKANIQKVYSEGEKQRLAQQKENREGDTARQKNEILQNEFIQKRKIEEQKLQVKKQEQEAQHASQITQEKIKGQNARQSDADNHYYRLLEKEADHQNEIDLRNGDAEINLNHDVTIENIKNQYSIRSQLLKQEHDIYSQELQHTHDKMAQIREIENQQTQQINQFIQEKHLQEQTHLQEQIILKANHEHEINTIQVNAQEARDTYISNINADIIAYAEKINRDAELYHSKSLDDMMVYKNKTQMDMAKRAGEALCYNYERGAEAKWKLWLMERELELFGRKLSEEEVEGIFKKNKSKWSKEVNE